MPTYPQLQAEIWWRREFEPPTIAVLNARLRTHYNVGAIAIGSKGDNNHLRGYHRSDAWIQNSIYCTNRTYSVSETTGNREPGDVDWLCAIDMTIPRPELIAACQRLDVAVRAGRLEKITEWYGNTDGDDRVDGYNNIADRVATSDASHLWHLHMSFDRGRAGDDHSDLYDILTGADDMACLEPTTQIPLPGAAQGYPEVTQASSSVSGILGYNIARLVRLEDRTTTLQADLASIIVSQAQILALLTAGVPVPGEVTLSDESVAAVAEAVVTEEAARLAE